jgi:hypothetical protein
MPKSLPSTGSKEKFNVPKDIVARARKNTKKGEKIFFTPTEIVEMLRDADAALNGDSNDDEHDALYQLRETLSAVYEDPDRRIK